MNVAKLSQWVVTPWVGIWLSTASAFQFPEIPDPIIQACLDQAMPKRALSQQLTLTSFDDSGVIEESAGSMSWLRDEAGLSKAIIRLSAPASRSGLAVLMHEKKEGKPKLYLYVPDLNRTRTVTGKQVAMSMMGTDFSYEEFSYMQNVADNNTTERLEDQELDGEASYVFRTTPGDPEATYTSIETFVDHKLCVPVATRFYRNEEIAKELLATRSEIQVLDGRNVPHQLVIHDRAKNTRTELVVTEVKIDPDLDESQFHPKRLSAAQ